MAEIEEDLGYVTAYGIALKNGFVGTEAQWLASLKQPALDAAGTANTAATGANTATTQANSARDGANTAATQANTARDNANTATGNANTATTQANTARDNANTAATNANNAATAVGNARGWVTVTATESDGADREVEKIVDYTDGTGVKPTANIGKYIGPTGLVNTKAEAKNVKGSTGPQGIPGITTTNMVTNRILGRTTAGTGTPEELITTGLMLRAGRIFNAVRIGVSDFDGGYIINNPEGGMLTFQTAATGALRIRVPDNLLTTNGLITIRGCFRDSASNQSFAFDINLNRAALSAGMCTATIYGVNARVLPVRFYDDGTRENRFIYIGNTSTTWSQFACFAITQIIISSNGAVDAYSQNWDLSIQTDFVGTIRREVLETRTVSNPYQIMAEYVAASGIDTPLTAAMSQLQMFQNLQKQMDSRLTIGQGDLRYNPYFMVNGTTGQGVLIKTNVASASNKAISLLITGTQLGVGVINTQVQLNINAGAFFTIRAVALGGVSFDINVFILAGNVCFFIPYLTPSYTQLYVKCIESGTNVITTVTNEVKPTTGVTVDTTISPLRSLLSADLGANNGVASLDSTGKIPVAQIPATAIVDTYVVNTQAAMLALAVQKGDLAVRTDLSKTFILQSEPATTLGNWVEMLSPTASVTSVAGRTGVVTLTKADVVLGNVDNTSDANKPVSTAQAAADALKANAANAALTGTPTAPTPSAGTNTTQLATTAFVARDFAPIRYGAPTAVAANITLALTDENKYLRVSGTRSVTVPLNATVAFSIGTQIDLTALASAVLTIVATGGVTINYKTGLVITGYASVSLIKVGTNEWDLIGN